MKENLIVSLSFKKAISIIKDEPCVMYKHGVWNRYKKTNTNEVIEAINRSGYGADVSFRDGMFYVSIPCDSDMW